VTTRPSPLRFRRAATLASAALLLALAATSATAAPKEGVPKAPLSIVKVTVTPPDAAADTLCKLSVDLANGGDRIASQLAFTVKVNGRELPVYKNQLFMQRLDPGKTTTLKLYNFWTSETSRPAAADGKYEVEVSLVAAKWYQIGDDKGTEVWTPLDPVPVLPVSAKATVGKASKP
jgi:hypothetical protein